MKNFLIFIFMASILVTTNSYARDSIQNYSIKEAMAANNAKKILGSDVSYYFGEQSHSSPSKNFGDIKTNRKTNAFNKTDLEACQWVFLSAMIALRDQAIKSGGNAVVNIQSNYKNNQASSTENFQCGAGAFIAGVALTGTIVTL